MNIKYDLLIEALKKIDINSYSGETLLSTEISVQSEDLQADKIGDILTIKNTVKKVDKYNNNRESTQMWILEIPAETEGLGKKFKVTRQIVENYDLEPKEK